MLEGERVVVQGQKLVIVPHEKWLDDKMRERDAVIMRLRQLDDTLIEFGRLTRPTIPQRKRW